MKKLLLILALATLTGCSNPTASDVRKEGELIRQEIQTQQERAKEEYWQMFLDVIRSFQTHNDVLRVTPIMGIESAPKYK